MRLCSLGIGKPDQKEPIMTGTIPGHEPAELAGVIVVGLLVFVPLFFYLCVKVGIKPTVGLFTAGLWPRKARRRQQQAQREGTPGEHADETPPQA
jgi:hypothetical protein